MSDGVLVKGHRYKLKNGAIVKVGVGKRKNGRKFIGIACWRGKKQTAELVLSLAAGAALVDGLVRILTEEA